MLLACLLCAPAMNSRYRRCYQVATDVVIASVLFANNSADVHAFTLKLHLTQPSATGTSTTQDTFTSGDCTSATCPIAYSTAAAARRQLLMRNSRQMRTVFRMAFDGLSTPSERELGREAERLEELRIEAEKSERRAQVSQELRVTAKTMRLQIEEALRKEMTEGQQLIPRTAKPHAQEVLEYKRGKLAEKLLKQDVLIEKLRKVHRRDSQRLTALVKQEIGEIDADLFMRILDLEGKNGEQEERGSSVFVHDVMQAMDRVDKVKALKVSTENKLYWNEFYESCSYGEAEKNRFARWLEEYQQERAAHQKARSAHPDPTKLDADFFRAFRKISAFRRDGTTDAALKVATNILLSGARATTCRGSLECVQGKYRQTGPLRYPDYVEGACCTGPVHYSVDVPEGNAHVATFEPGPAGEHPLGRFFGYFQDHYGWGTNLGHVVGIFENYIWVSSGPSPELEAFLEALAASGSVAFLTNTRMDGGGGRALGQLLDLTIYRRSTYLSSVKILRLGLRLLARMSFLSAEQAAAVGCTHPFMALLRIRPRSKGLYSVEEIDLYRCGNGAPYVDDAILQVLYLTIFMYRRYPWPQGQQYRVDATIAKWVEEDLDRSFDYHRRSLVRSTLKWAVSLPGFFQALLEDHSIWLLLAACDIEERHLVGKNRGCFFFNASFRSRQQENLLIRELKNNRLLTAWVCGKAGRYILLEICRQRRRRVVQAIATAAPSAFAAAVPELLVFMRGPNVRGKKERLVEWLESKLEENEEQDMHVHFLDRK